MKHGPSNAKLIFLNSVNIDSIPKSAIDWLVDICISEGWFANTSDAREAAERWESKFLNLLRNELSTYNEIGRFAPFDFNSSSDYLLQGCAYIEPKDDISVKEAKKNRSLYNDYVNVLEGLTPREFEALCVGLLHIIGVDDPKITAYSADEGIDFYGKLKLDRFIFAKDFYPGIQRQLSTWMIGQAKHYNAGDVSTFEIRDLVGAVELAKGKAFGALGEKYADLEVRVCDPVIYLFFTTGRITANSWRLLEKSGVAGMDGNMIAAFLADRQVGVATTGLNKVEFLNWIAKYY